MKAVKLIGPRTFRVEEVPLPPDPEQDEVLLRVCSVGVCGSDLHTYHDARIGDTVVQKPLILGHEFSGVVAAVGSKARDGLHQPLSVGQRVAVDPATPCWHCDRCEHGHPNLCRNLRFMGLYPEDGALQDYRLVPARNCFPIPEAFTMEEAALLEAFGVTIHAVDLGKIRVGQSAAVLGCGPIGLMIIKLAKLAGAMPIYAFDQFGWRLEAALRWGADEVFNITDGDPLAALFKRTHSRGVRGVFEAAWGAEAIGQAIEMADLGGRVVLVGIPRDDHATFKHSTARRKGLSILMSRRMKHTYPRAMTLVERDSLDLKALITHRFDLAHTADAYALNAAYQDNVIKAMINLE